MPLVEPNAKFGEEWTRIQERQLGQPASKRIYTFLHVTWRLVVRAERRVTVEVGYMESWMREMVAAFITGDKYRYLEVDDVNDLIEEKFQTMWDSLRDNEDTHSVRFPFPSTHNTFPRSLFVESHIALPRGNTQRETSNGITFGIHRRWNPRGDSLETLRPALLATKARRRFTSLLSGGKSRSMVDLRTFGQERHSFQF